MGCCLLLCSSASLFAAFVDDDAAELDLDEEADEEDEEDEGAPTRYPDEALPLLLLELKSMTDHLLAG